MSTWYRLLLLFLLSISAAHARTQMTAEETYNLGQRYMKRGSYVKALEQFNRVRTYFRDDPFALKAELAIADLHYQKNEWDAARLAYEDFLRAHPRYNELDYVVYRLGLTAYKKAPLVAARDQTWARQAVNTWSSFPVRFPQSPHSEEVDKLLQKARDRLAHKELLIGRFYDKREAWPAVAGRMENLLRQYPQSPDRAEALYLLGRAYAGLEQYDLAQSALQKLEQEAPGSVFVTRLRRALP